MLLALILSNVVQLQGWVETNVLNVSYISTYGMLSSHGLQSQFVSPERLLKQSNKKQIHISTTKQILVTLLTSTYLVLRDSRH